MKWKARMIEVTRIPEKKAPRRKSWKTTFKAKPALSGKFPEGPIASPALPDNVGQSFRVQEGTAAESPDMNTMPDAGGGSVSSF
jgi:hypothetical protein